MTTTESRSGHGDGARAGYAAALWSLLFALAHAVWAMGWYVGLPAEDARHWFQQTWFLVYDLIVAGMCIVAVFVALALVQSWGRRLPRRLLLFLGWGAAGLLGLRGLAGVIQGVYLIAFRGFKPNPMQLYDLWFCFGGALFGISVWHFARETERAKLDS
ncbi:MAG TPA: DUF3995 domain-containing protein [Thermoanaerobaculia bacterium]|jgi:hypothetical protein|nr:DUF3995 domain-containing protein [Thermoanaerobaculia bacterium]